MTNKLPYVTIADPTLDHQVVFLLHANRLVVSCNCRTSTASNGGVTHEIMGRVEGNLAKARLFYNDPALHNKPFGKDDEAKW